VTTGRAAFVGAALAFVTVVSAPVPGAGAQTGIGRAERSPGCGRQHAGGTTQETLPFDSGTREFRLAIPNDYSGKKPVPVILNYHGFGSNAIQQAVYSQLEQKGPAHGYVVATPQGTGNQAFWNILPSLPKPDDVAFANALIDHLERSLCIDPKRVFATGISNGAGMSAYLACKLEDRFAAIAPVAGVNLVAPCPTGKPLSVFAFHGSADPIVPYNGGTQQAGALRGTTLPSVPESVGSWATRDGCSPKPKTRLVSEHVRLDTYQRCKKATDVRLYTVDGGGHTWPGSIDVPRLGPVTQEINAADLMLKLFNEHPQR
jgi:polyhydroxybutyrate depolymerase